MSLGKTWDGVLIARSMPGHILNHLKRRACRARAKALNPGPLPYPHYFLSWRREATGGTGVPIFDFRTPTPGLPTIWEGAVERSARG